MNYNNNVHYNALCFADDILLIGVTVTGLQALTDSVVKTDNKKGLKFNTLKKILFQKS